MPSNKVVAAPRQTKGCLRESCNGVLTQRKNEGRPQFYLRSFCTVKCSNSRTKVKVKSIPARWGFI